jgi:hypothetical protein
MGSEREKVAMSAFNRRSSTESKAKRRAPHFGANECSPSMSLLTLIRQLVDIDVTLPMTPAAGREGIAF